MVRQINATIQIRHSTTTEWSSNNPILAVGEIGFDTTKMDFKIGNGTSAWNNLDYVISKHINEAITTALNTGV